MTCQWAAAALGLWAVAATAWWVRARIDTERLRELTAADRDVCACGHDAIRHAGQPGGCRDSGRFTGPCTCQATRWEARRAARVRRNIMARNT